MRRLLPLLALPLALTAAAPPGSAPFTVAESGERSDNLQQLLSDIRGQDATIVIAPGVYHQCAVQQAGHITYKAAVPGQVIFDGTTCEGKAALVLRGAGARVDGVVFQNMRVPDGNGAGIRLETGDLHVTNAMFIDGQCGILTASFPRGRITIERSTFAPRPRSTSVALPSQIARSKIALPGAAEMKLISPASCTAQSL